VANSDRTIDIAIKVLAADRQRLNTLFRDPQVVDRVLDVVLRAGATEALEYATGRAVFSSMTELRMFRVYQLLLAGMTTDEAEQLLPLLFKLSPAGARRIVASTFARYAIELDQSVTASIESVLDAATWSADVDRWFVDLPPGFTKERVLELVRGSTEPDPIRAQGARWQFPDETYAWLRSELRLHARAHP
jgi:hypothetical protein